MTDYGARRPVVLQTYEPGQGPIQLGVISRSTLGFGYYNNIAAKMFATGEWGVAPCVVELMREWAVPMIYYWDAETGKTYTASLGTLTEQGHVSRYGKREPYYHLAIAAWSPLSFKVKYDYVKQDATLVLKWISLAAPKPAAQPAQLALSLFS